MYHICQRISRLLSCPGSRKQCYSEQRGVLVRSLQSCLTLGDPKHCSVSGSSVHGIFPARILEWVAMPFSSGSSQRRDWTHVSCISCTGRQVLYHWATGEAWTLGYMCLFELWFLQDVCPERGLLGHMVVLFLVFFKGISIPFSMVAVSVYIPTLVHLGTNTSISSLASSSWWVGLCH